MYTPLTLTHLRFECVARTHIHLGAHQAGERLRDALAAVMLRAVCSENPRRQKPTPEHAAACPVCWLLAAEADPGVVRRAYALVPPIPLVDMIAPGQRFSFTITLFGRGYQYLPYFVLAAPEMGRTGVGPGRGVFELDAIWAINPLIFSLFPKEEGEEGVMRVRDGVVESVLAPGSNLVRAPNNHTTWEQAETVAAHIAPDLEQKKSLTIQFITPTRLVDGEALVKAPDFGVFFRRLLKRFDELGEQFAGQEKRSMGEIERLHDLADQVRLVETDTHWVELWGPSGRTGRRTPMGGFVGSAVYRAREWGALLPWLLFGQGVQAGKLTVKGNGVYQIVMPGLRSYWLDLDTMSSKEAGF